MNDAQKQIMQLVYSGALSAEKGAEIFKQISASENRTGRTMDIAIVGMSGRFPKADNVNEYWNNLLNGKDCVSDISERWDISDIYSDKPNEPNKSYSRWGGLMNRIDDFDPLFFELSPRQAELMEPRQRIFLMEAWKALEDAGYVQKKLSGTQCGIFIGCEGSSTYFREMNADKMNGYSVLGHSNAILTARLAYYLNLQGPSVAVDTACSSSLVAVHEACMSIQSNDCEIAIAAGTTVITDPNSYPLLCNMGMLSHEGKCKTFDNSADGFVPGECVAAVILKPLEKAKKDKDHIYGVIKGSGSNQDGKTNSITAPSALSQERLERRIYKDYGIDPHTISYVEAHGTGTRLGDPIEIDALRNAFDYKNGEKQYCGIGSVKTNIGHTAASSGIASLIKVLLSMQHKKIPPTIHYNVENKQIDFKNSPFYVVDHTQEWDTSVNPLRRAAISSFGYGGTNCHLVVEEYKEQQKEEEEKAPYYIIPFSAKSKEAYRQKLQDYSAWLEEADTKIEIGNLSYQLFEKRSHFSIRGCFMVRNMEELIQALKEVTSNRESKVYYTPDAVNQTAEISLNKETGNEILKTFHQMKEPGMHYEEKLFYIMLCYLKGYDLEWNLLFHSRHTVVSMPGYSFSKKRYWLRDDDLVSAQTSVSKKISESTPVQLNMPEEKVESLSELIDTKEKRGDIWYFKKKFHGEEFYVKDHNWILPGAVTVEMVRQAARILEGEKDIFSFDNLMWGSPVVIYEGHREVYVKMIPKDANRVKCEVFSIEEGKEDIHFRTTIVYKNREKSTKSIPVAEVLQRTNGGTKEVKFFHECLQNMRIEMGARLHGMVELHYNEKEALSKLDIHESTRSSFHRFVLHPTLIDGGLQTIVGWMYQIIGNTEHIYLPYSLSKFQFYYPERKPCYAYVVQNSSGNAKDVQTISYDMKYLDENGTVIYEMTNFTYRQFSPEEKYGELPEDNPIHTLYYKESWVRKDLLEGNPDYSGEVWVVLEGKEELSRRLREQEKLRNTTIVRVIAGDRYECTGPNEYILNPSVKEEFKMLVKELKGRGKLTFIINWSEPGLSIEEKKKMGITSCLFLSQALMMSFINKETKLVFLHNGDAVDAAVSGFAKTLVIEKEQYKFSVIQTEPGMPVETILINEIRELSDIQVQYSNGYRYVKQFHEIMVKEQQKNKYIKDQGTYLITGGAGGLGLSFAEYLIKTYNAKVVLLGRSELNASKKAKIAGWNEKQERAFYIKCDIADKCSFQTALDEIKQKNLVINGVLHAAGVIKDSLIMRKQEEEFKQVIAPKMYGLDNIMNCMNLSSMDFIVIFSSTTSALGNMGQCDYAYANAYMDNIALKYGEQSAVPRIVAINWPMWAEGGMIIDDKVLEVIKSRSGLIPLKTIDGIHVMENCLNSEENQLIILSGEVSKIRKNVKKQLNDAGEESDFVQAEEVRPQKEVKQNEKSISGKQTVKRDNKAAFQNDLKEIVGKILSLDKDEIDFSRNLSDFGFDSISFTDFASAINDKFDLDVTPALFFGFTYLDEIVNSLWSEYEESICYFYSDMGEKIVVQEPERINENKVEEPAEQEEQSDKQVYKIFTEEVMNIICDILGTSKEDIDFSKSLSDYGFDSISFTDLASKINDKYDLDLTPAVFFGYTFLDEMVQNIWSQYEEKIRSVTKLNYQTSSKTAEQMEKTREVVQETKEILEEAKEMSDEIPKQDEADLHKNETVNRDGYEPIAIIGMSGALPKSDTLEEFWQRIKNNESLVTEIPKDRWNWEECYGEPDKNNKKTKVKYGAFMNEVDKFDPMFFNIPGFDAELMDPQERLILEHVWKTMEDAGYKSEDISGTNTGIFVGVSAADYKELLLENRLPTMLSQTFITNRISYLLNIHGPSEPVDTACSSSLVAIHKAIEAIHDGDCKMAFVGGVNVIVSPNLYFAQSVANMLALDGKCKTFDASANGYVRGEGIVTMLLKPLKDAEKDGDHIYGVIRGSAINHGGRASNLFAPNAKAQSEVIMKACENAKIDPSTVSYIEAHGTGTSLGDPIEIDGLKMAYKNLYHQAGKEIKPEPVTLIGSVKTNTGHLEAASGITGLVKVLFAMRDHLLPGLINFKKLNPYIHLDSSPFAIVTENTEWNNQLDENHNIIPRRAGISSFGVGGVNAHIVLEEYLGKQPQADKKGEKVFVISAKEESVLYDYAEQIEKFIQKQAEPAESSSLKEEIKNLAAELLEIEPEEIKMDESLEECGMTPFVMRKLLEELKKAYQLKEEELDYSLNQSIHEIASKVLENTDIIQNTDTSLSLDSLAYTLQTGRDAYKERAAFVAGSVRELKDEIEHFLKRDIKEYKDSIFTGNKKIEHPELDMESLYEKKELRQLAKVWSEGEKVDWSRLYKEKHPDRISAPSYPFMQERYWYEEKNIQKAEKKSLEYSSDEELKEILNSLYNGTMEIQ